MSEITQDAPPTDYDSLVEEFKRVGGAVEAYGQFIQDGIEIEDFAASKPGKILIGRSINASKEALKAILDPNLNDAATLTAVRELRVQHRVLESIAQSIAEGRRAERALRMDESVQELSNPDQENEDVGPLASYEL